MFFSRPWFSRRWILQEVIQARHAIFYCGEAMITSEVLVQAASWFRHPDLKFLGLDDTILESVMQMQSMMWGLNQHVKGRGVSDILDLLDIFQGNDCSDDKDRIFALLGLVDRGPLDGFNFPVDYHQSTASIFVKFATQILEQRDTIDILAFSGAMQRFSQTKPSLNLPSWVPDWRFREKFKPLARSTEPLLGPQNGPSLFTRDSNILRLQGLIFDKVAKASLPDTAGDSELESDDISKQWMEISKFFQGLTRYVNASSQTYLNCVRRTIMADNSHSRTGQSSIIDFVFAFMLGRGATSHSEMNASFSIQNEVTRHEDGSVSSTVNLNDVANANKPLGFAELVKITTAGRSFFVTEKGYIGIGPADTRLGDIVSVFRGARVPFLVRLRSADLFMLIGDCYVHEMMDDKDSWMKTEAQQDFRIE